MKNFGGSPVETGIKRNQSFLVHLFLALSLSTVTAGCSSSSAPSSESAVKDAAKDGSSGENFDFRSNVREELKNYATFSMQTLTGFPIQFNSGIKAVVPGVNLKKVTANTLRTCNNFQKLIPGKFPEQIKKIAGCKVSGTVCDNKKRIGCINDYSANILFSTPQTISVLTKVFMPREAAGSEKEACLKWVEKQESSFADSFVFGACNYSYQIDDDSRVTGEIYAFPSVPTLAKKTLEEHNMAQALARHTRFFMRIKDREAFKINFTRSPKNPANAFVKSEEKAKAECEAIRTDALKKGPTVVKSAGECVPEELGCADTSLPSCKFAFNLELQLKAPALVYSLAKEFISQYPVDKTLADCQAWLSAEKKFAGEGFLGGSCAIISIENEGASKTVTVEGEIREINLP